VLTQSHASFAGAKTGAARLCMILLVLDVIYNGYVLFVPHVVRILLIGCILLYQNK
jgi:hypothetical protein